MNKYYSRILWVTVFAIAMAYVESAVVVYLRAIFHPEGFTFPLKIFESDYKIVVEIFREAATIGMLVAVSALAGKTLWERFSYFMLAFGIWDIFYYVWLKVILDWPASIFDWDVLFLIPMTWIGPVIVPVSVSLVMIVFGILIIHAINNGAEFRASMASYILALAGISAVLYSFMSDTGATIDLKMPQPYRYEILIIGDLLLGAAFMIPLRKTKCSS